MKNFMTVVVLVAAALSWPPAPAGADDIPWRQVGAFRSDSRNVAVGPEKIRVVTQIDLVPLKLTGKYIDDSGIVERAYPGWNYKDDLVILYSAFPSGFRQTSYHYALGTERDTMAGDPVAPSLGIFDHTGKARVELPKDVGARIGIRREIVAATSGNLDDDPELEWVVVFAAGSWDVHSKEVPVNLSIVDRQSGRWAVIESFPIVEKSRSGPLEIRDVTGDDKPDIIYRTFGETMGHIWVTAYIFTNSVGMAPMIRTPVFRPEIQEDPGSLKMGQDP